MTQDNSDQDAKYPQRSGAQSPASAVQLRDDIARTRSALSDDVKALGEKLDPERLKQDVKEVIHHARDAAREGAKDMVHDAKEAAVDTLRNAKDHAIESISEGVNTVGKAARAATQSASRFTTANAIPLALLGAGTGWLLWSLSKQRRQRTEDFAGSTFLSDGRATPRAGIAKGGSVTSRAVDAFEDARDRVVDGAHAVESSIADGAGALRDKVTHGAVEIGEQTAALSRRAYASMGRMGTSTLEFCADNPLAIALVAIASGTAFGLLLPSTRREDALLGGTRDKLKDRVQRSASELKGSMERRVDEVRDIIDEVRQPSSHA